ncbi:androgen-dependent TFPI-regulating protein isoform X2 [Latimeria chalumnae]|uniref:Androgen dependent TFPI regulating protein n=1 Tax=Latimeria chalumnae TaxID=7897 RepID=M3XJ79_LATCH|nr:PREDICTED: androgen-dependent TFPI-regulating protein-like isoform X2 [Latimeria chalumnae]|eukprot:XP_005993637.1 PREDICTED: androgen-dependent TFPI-regulating protein-like isoform X2 [Latimeria chalumnae]
MAVRRFILGNGRLLVHLAVFFWYAFTLWQNVSITSPLHPGNRTYGGRWKYLTVIDLVLQLLFFGVCVLADVVSLLSNGKEKPSYLSQLKSVRDMMFSALAFPVGVFVVFTFWSLYIYDRDLVYPKMLDEIIPLWLNHAMHTFILPLLLLETYIVPHHYPSKKMGLLGLTAFCFLYLMWIFWINYASGIWVYPILAKLNTVGLAVFLTVSALIMVPFYLLGEKLNSVFWGTSEKEKLS